MLVLQDSLIEELLELFVAIIYAKLLETVDFEIFYKHTEKKICVVILLKLEKSLENVNNLLTESGDIQHTDVVTRSLERYAFVNSCDNVIE